MTKETTTLGLRSKSWAIESKNSTLIDTDGDSARKEPRYWIQKQKMNGAKSHDRYVVSNLSQYHSTQNHKEVPFFSSLSSSPFTKLQRFQKPQEVKRSTFRSKYKNTQYNTPRQINQMQAEKQQ